MPHGKRVGNGLFSKMLSSGATVSSRVYNQLIDELNAHDPGYTVIERLFTIDSDNFAGDNTWELLEGVTGGTNTGIVLPDQAEIVSASLRVTGVTADGPANDVFFQLVPYWVQEPAEVADTDNHLLRAPLVIDEAVDTVTLVNLVAGGVDDLTLRPVGPTFPAGGIDFNMVDGGAIGDVATIAVTGDVTSGIVITATVDNTAVTGTKINTLIFAINASVAARRYITASLTSGATGTTVIGIVTASTAITGTDSVLRRSVASSFLHTAMPTSFHGTRLIAKATLNDAANTIVATYRLAVAVRTVNRPDGL